MMSTSPRNGLLGRALFFGALAELLFGYDLGIAGIALLSISEQWEMSPAVSGFVVSSLLLGATIGVAVAGRLADRFGRRPILMLISAFFIVGGILAAVAPDVSLLILGRFIMGLGVGGSASVVTIYLVEIAPTRHRGKIGSLGQVMVVLGILLAYIVGYALQPSDAWRWMIGLSVVPGAILAVGLVSMPESPRWFVSHGRPGDARRSLERLSHPDVDGELAELEAAHHRSPDRQVSLGEVLRRMFSPGLRRNSIAACILAALVQFTGANSIIYYAPAALIDAGFSEGAAVTANVSVGVVNVLFTLLGLFLVDRLPRRALLTVGMCGMTTAMIYLAAVSQLGPEQSAVTGFLTLGGMLLFLASFAMSWGILVRVVVSELFPSAIRGTATGLALLLNWVANFVVGQTFPSLLAVSATLSFGLFAVIGVCALVFIRRVLPETGAGSTLEEVASDEPVHARA
ncbi:sugar porter family MFS transporter [Brachybacterium sp. YJGR34]|uniref:sugar porter family MFS transporter n=1 Tax=Brachybacterium sp. YJGR34 TaxID=2059911 RepID=UPI000E0C2C69|nr:sugar porter family MFS transporter [Brachybacterium sp. YJGR34]